MPERIELNPDLAPVTIPQKILNEMASHALETLPEECCGLVLGDERERFQAVFRCRNEMTRLHRGDPQRYPRDGREAFHMNETDYLAAQRQAEAGGGTVTAIYHSHVGYGVYFSARDQEYAQQEIFPFPEADHFVLSVLDRHVRAVGMFQRSLNDHAFVGRAVLLGSD